MNIKYKINHLIKHLCQDLQERDEAIKLAMLALLSNESIFLLGPPGVAKSLVARKIRDVIVGATNFEYLMNKFSTPDEIFGPISLKKLDEDIYERKVAGYLPSAHIGFLDEIWKASPSIQNTLLTIINEKLYQNGNQVISVPLLLLIAASNELPQKNQGLEALYDRFTIRLFVNNIHSMYAFRELLDGQNQSTPLEDDQKLSINEINSLQKIAPSIRLDDETFFFIETLKQKIASLDNPPYISDRRWKKIMNVLRIATVASDEVIIQPHHWILVQNMVWDSFEDIKNINDCIEYAFSEAVVNKYHKDTYTKIQRSIERTSLRMDSEFEYHDTELKLTNNFKRGPLHIYQSNSNPNEFLVAQFIESNSHYQCVYKEKVKRKNIDFRNQTVNVNDKHDNDYNNFFSVPYTMNYGINDYTLYKYRYASGDIAITNEIKNECQQYEERIKSFRKSIDSIARELNGKESIFGINYQKFIAKMDIICKEQTKMLKQHLKEVNARLEEIILDIQFYGK